MHDTENLDLIQRNATITSCTEKNPALNASDSDWVATGTLERYGVEIQWQARKTLDNVHWSIELAPQEYVEADGAFDREKIGLVIDGSPDWRSDVATVLAPYPPCS